MGEQHSIANKVALAFVAGSAGVQALQQAVKDAPDLVRHPLVPDMNAGAWNYVPLLLISAAGVIWLWDRFFRPGSEVGQATVSGFDEPVAPPAIVDREYLPATFSKAFLALHRANHSGAERTALLRPHIGKWMRLSAYRGFTGTTSSDRIHVILDPSAKRGTGSVGISVSFPGSAEAVLAGVKLHSKVDLDVQIVETHGDISLKNAELL